jgi:hypothetical protein
MSCAWFASLHADLAAVAADAARRSAHFHFAHYETVRAVASAPAAHRLPPWRLHLAARLTGCRHRWCILPRGVLLCVVGCCILRAACCFALALRRTEPPQTTPVLSLLGLLREDPYAFVGADVEQREFNGCGLRSGSP